ncbi:MAG: hypothetical protein HY644_01505 [Acidobacteria bacterium]|nr:hypothetical protein [Acidobacteriota bacterium]
MNLAEQQRHLADDLLEFLSEASEFVLVTGRQCCRFARGDFHSCRSSAGLEFNVGPFRLVLQYPAWRRTTHRFTLGSHARVVLLKPSRKNELWLRRQQFRWRCEERAGQQWKLIRSAYSSACGGPLLHMVLRKGKCWFVAVAAGDEENVRVEVILSQLFALWRRFEFSGARRVEAGFVFVPYPLADLAARLLDDLQAPVRVYCLPALKPFCRAMPAAFPLLWPSQHVRAELRSLYSEFGFPVEVHALVRNAKNCSFEYLGIAFAVFDADHSTWRFPLRDSGTEPDGDVARGMVRQEYQRIRAVRRSHARFRTDPCYQLHSERWLESLILQDPKVLDPELRTFPIYAQVPAYATRRRVIDLVAVTEGGRLVVIEVKTQRAIDLLFQGLSYWRIVLQAHQQDAFHQNGYFLGVRLTDEPPLLYCVTPLLLLHAEERYLAQRLGAAVEAYLIGINHDWRRRLKVLRKERLC